MLFAPVRFPPSLPEKSRMRRNASAALLFTAILSAAPLAAQQNQPPAQPPQAAPQQPAQHPVVIGVPPARPEDVSSIDAIIAALYDVISGPAGQPRDWNRMRSLFVPHGRLMPTGPRPGNAVGVRLLEVNDYIASSGPTLERMGFREREIARRVERYGHIAHVFSTYEGRMETEQRTIRGINSIQLLNDGTRWWVISVYWEAETPDNPLPAQYLTTPN
jgi:hypothetical protein